MVRGLVVYLFCGGGDSLHLFFMLWLFFIFIFLMGRF